jgi:hypothetical protein
LVEQRLSRFGWANIFVIYVLKFIKIKKAMPTTIISFDFAAITEKSQCGEEKAYLLNIRVDHPDTYFSSRRSVMSVKVTSILRSAALLGVAVAALAMAPVARAADEGFAPRPDFPGAKQQEPLAAQPDPGLAPRAGSPRPDFPGAKQPDNPATPKTPQSDQK